MVIPELDRLMDATSSSVTSENTDVLMEEGNFPSDALPASLKKWLQLSEENISPHPKGCTGIADGASSLETLKDSLGKTFRQEEEEGPFKHFRSRFGGSAESIFSVASSRSLQTPEWKVLRLSKSQSALVGASCVDWEHTWRREIPKEGIIQDIVDDVVGDEVNFRVPARQGYDKSTDVIEYPEMESRTAGHTEKTNSPSSMCSSLMTTFCSLSESPPKKHIQTGLILHSGNQQYLPKPCESGQIQFSQNKSTPHCTSSSSGPSSTLDSAAHRSEGWPEKHGTQFRTLESNTSCRWEDRISNNSQTTEDMQDVSLPLLRAILMDREEKMNQISKELQKMQIENQKLLEEKHHLSESKKLKRMEEISEEELKNPVRAALDPTSPILLQRQIASLKSQINDLQEANGSAVLELAKTDEEISQQKNDVAELRAEYSQKLEDFKEEVNLLQQKINRIESRFSSLEMYGPGLCEEISQLRSQSRQLREVNHQLNEENHQLKEDLWDLKRQFEQLVRRLEDRQNERPWEHRKGNASPGSLSSASTDLLLSRYQEGETPHSKKDKKVGDCEEIQEISDDVLSSASHSHGDARHDLVCCGAAETPSGLVLPKRPFAPRSVADLKVGNLVKFSRPAGKISKGRVKYLGRLFGREDVYLGVELEGSEMGKHDGTFEGIRHFVCKANKGVFVNFSKIIMAWE
ncbi:centrosome-associated protein 350 [Microcaecilia unicolor]|uniref:Centrosome-associated protein 350-like n=1 Tax=Microcaecilia unicolor TaxID=1415580 RepID=A0A6P7XJ92_9AMPH|nr:centrosome-associated protein 350-like [Microcaecilia unicolor]